MLPHEDNILNKFIIWKDQYYSNVYLIFGDGEWDGIGQEVSQYVAAVSTAYQ